MSFWNPMITSSPMTSVGVPMLLYLVIRSCWASGSSAILRVVYSTFRDERYSFALSHGAHPGLVKTMTEEALIGDLQIKD